MLPNFLLISQYRLVFPLALVFESNLIAMYFEAWMERTYSIQRQWKRIFKSLPCFHSLKGINWMLKEYDTIPKIDIRSKPLSNIKKTLLIPQKTPENFVLRYFVKNTIIRQQTIAQKRRSYHDRNHQALNIKSATTSNSLCANSYHWSKEERRIRRTNGRPKLIVGNLNSYCQNNRGCLKRK